MFNREQQEAFVRVLDSHSTPMQITLNNYDGCMNFTIDERGFQRTKYEIDVAGKTEVLSEHPPPDSAV